MVVDQGFEPCRSSPSDRSPGIIRPRRIPMLSTNFVIPAETRAEKKALQEGSL